ncbi:MAG: golvesin C-terminal-like domain-containing protein [Promethearchaeota archaeon]
MSFKNNQIIKKLTFKWKSNKTLKFLLIVLLCINLMLPFYFSGNLHINQEKNEDFISNLKSSDTYSVSVTDPSPYFTKGSYSGHLEYWYTYIHNGHEYIWTYIGGMENNPSQPDCWAEFKPYLPQAGKYEVYSCFYADPQNSDDVPHTIYYDGGSTTIPVSQNAPNYFTWTRYKLGTWDFAAGESSRVVITDANGEIYDGYTTLNADTIEFVLVNNKPNTPTLARQFFSDGVTQILEGGTTSEHTVVFKAFVSDPDAILTEIMFVSKLNFFK